MSLRRLWPVPWVGGWVGGRLLRRGKTRSALWIGAAIDFLVFGAAVAYFAAVTYFAQPQEPPDWIFEDITAFIAYGMYLGVSFLLPGAFMFVSRRPGTASR